MAAGRSFAEYVKNKCFDGLYEAAEMAVQAEVEEMWLTHFSPSLIRAEEYMPKVREIFANAHLGRDGKSVELTFREE